MNYWLLLFMKEMFSCFRRNNQHMLSILFAECSCPKAQKMADDPREVVDAVCDLVGECKCPDSERFSYTERGCVGKGKSKKRFVQLY